MGNNNFYELVAVGGTEELPRRKATRLRLIGFLTNPIKKREEEE